MLPQPLPPGAPLAPPPPPPPPPLSTAAFSAAAHAAARAAPPYRTPTLHIAVIHGPATVPLLRHAYDVLFDLASKGLHVFLQTEIEVPPPGNIAPITNETIHDVIATSAADFFVAIADRNLADRTVQIRLSPSADFVTVPSAHLRRTVFESWVRTIRLHHDPDALEALARNPNIVTDAHIHKLLVACADVPNLRRSYAALLRLVSVTHNWESPKTAHQKTQSIPAAHLSQFSTHTTGPLQASTDQDTDSALGLESNSNIPDDHGFDHDSSHFENDGIETEAHASAKPEAIADRNNSLGNNVAISLEENRPCTASHRAEVDRALQEGIEAIVRTRRRKDNPTAKKKTRMSQKSNMSITWLKRSPDIAARVLRSQLLVWSIHQRLLSAYDLIASLPVLHVSSLRGTTAENTIPRHLPSEASRQRLLREINEILPRIEEIGASLTKRPKAHRRRKRFCESDPWSVYVWRSQSSAAKGRKRKHSAGFTSQSSIGPLHKTWRCYGCLSYNESQVSTCSVCSSPSCVVEQAWLEDNKNLLTQRFKKAVNGGIIASTPWIFGQSVHPIPTPRSDSTTDKGAAVGMERRHAPISSPHQSEKRNRMLSGVGQKLLSPREENGGMLPTHPIDLIDRFSATMSFHNQNLACGSDTHHRPRSNGDIGPHLVPVSHHGSSVPIRPSQVSPVRLATSAPNGPSFMETEMSRKIGTRLGPQSGRDVSAKPPFAGGSNPTKFSHDDNFLGHPVYSSVGLPLLSGAEGLPSSLPRDIARLRDVGKMSHYELSLRNEHVSRATTEYVEPAEPTQEPRRKAGLSNPVLEELTRGSYEAAEDIQSSLMDRRVKRTIVDLPMPNLTSEPSQHGIASLEALAAASDAANGGTGSATKESLRAVSAVVSSSRNHTGSQSEGLQNGTYNMF